MDLAGGSSSYNTYMCKYCKGTGKYPLLDRFVDCDQCDAAAKGCSESDEISTPAPGVVFRSFKVNLPSDWLTHPPGPLDA